MSLDELAAVIRSVLAPGQFFVRPPLALDASEGPEEVFWELFHGRALDRAMTRQRARFYAWNVTLVGRPVPLVSVKLEEGAGRLFVVRWLLCRGAEAFEVAPNVIESRPAEVWTRELVGTIDLVDHSSASLRNEIETLIHLAVIGTGRLPLTSLEAPLPEFTLGQCGYFPVASPPMQALTAEEDLWQRQVETRFRVKALELALRAGGRPRSENVVADLRELFLGVSLSPYTGMVRQAIMLLRRVDAAPRAEFLAWLLRLQWRHLNAYDLVEFHHRGANYPDALLVDEVLRELLTLPCATRSARAGLRLGWLLRTLYAGRHVPEQPTSPGDNLRVWPTTPVPDEQLQRPEQGPRVLFAEPLKLDATQREILAVALQEADYTELGTALFLDRPLGISKEVGEPDATPIFSHVLYSDQLARRNLDRLGAVLPNTVPRKSVAGIPMPRLSRRPRPGVLSLTDADRVASDFQVLRTTRSSVASFRAAFDWRALDVAADWQAVVPTPANTLRVFDERRDAWCELTADWSHGFSSRGGVETPRAGLRVTELHGRSADLPIPPAVPSPA